MTLMETIIRKRRRDLCLKRYKDVLPKLKLAVDFLYKEGAKEVYLFGSIINPQKFTEHSDVDLFVKGIGEERHIEVEGKLEEILGDFEYDILFFEEHKYIRKKILTKIKEEAILWKPSL